MRLADDNVVAFQRTVWSTTKDTGDEAAYATLWSGAAADVAKFKLEIQLTRVDAAFKVTPAALVSNDGDTWVAAPWVGTAPGEITGEALNAVGPFQIDPFHGKALLRIALKVEASTGTALVFGHARGRLTLFDAERAELDVSGGSYAAGDGLSLTGTTFAVDGTVVRPSTTPQFLGVVAQNPTTSAAELLTAKWTGDLTPDTDQYWLAAYNSAGLVGGVRGNGGSYGLQIVSTGGNLELVASGGGNVEFWSDGAERGLMDASGNWAVGTSSGVTSGRNSKVQVHGAGSSSTASPSVQLFPGDTYPTISISAYSHDNMDIAFDAWWGGASASWYSSDSGSSALISKYNDHFHLSRAVYGAGNPITGWSRCFTLDLTDGKIGAGDYFGGGASPTWEWDFAGSPGDATPLASFSLASSYTSGRLLRLGINEYTGTGYYFVYFVDYAGTIGSVSGDAGSGVDFNVTSDEAQKENVRDAAIGDARSIVRALRERDWEPKAPGAKKRSGRGYIAQELHEVYPDAVKPGYETEVEENIVDSAGHKVRGPDGTPLTTKVVRSVPWQISPMRLIPLLARALREQDVELAELRVRIAALEAARG